MNRVSMVGNITKDADMRYTPNNKAIVSFSIAINEGFGANKTTQYFNIVSFGAEKLCQYLTKGKTVAITGN
jgi:single-strand DNA-binding protein